MVAETGSPEIPQSSCILQLLLDDPKSFPRQMGRETGNLDLKEDVVASPGTKDEPPAFDRSGSSFVTFEFGRHHNFGLLRKTVTAV